MNKRIRTHQKCSRKKCIVQIMAMFLSVVLVLSGAGMTVFAEEAGEMITEFAETAEIENVEMENKELQATLPIILQEGDYSSVHWSIDSDGKLLVAQDEEYEYEFFEDCINPWSEYWNLVRSIEINANCYLQSGEDVRLAFDFSGLEEAFYINKISFGKDFDSSMVTDMSGLFSTPAHVSQLDLTNLDTSNVWNMSDMFDLQLFSSIPFDLSSFDMSNVTQGFELPEVSAISTPKNLKVDILLDDYYTWVKEGTEEKYDCLPQNLEESIVLVAIDEWEEEPESEWKDVVGTVSGTYDILSWELTEGCLTISQTSEPQTPLNDLYRFNQDAPWYEYRGNVEKLHLDTNLVAYEQEWIISDETYVNKCPIIFNCFPNLKEITFGEKFDSSLYQSLSSMFAGCKNLEKVDLSKFDTKNAISMYAMFQGCEKLSKIDVSGFTTENVVDMGMMFCGCSSLAQIDVSGFDTSNVTSMAGMFEDCYNLEDINVSGFDTSNVTSMIYMFWNCRKIKSFDLTSWDLSNLENNSFMFQNCISLESVKFGETSTPKLYEMLGIVQGCENLKEIDFGLLSVYNVERMMYAFKGCKSLEYVDLSNFALDKCKDVLEFFKDCDALCRIKTPYWVGDLRIALPITDYNQRWYRTDWWEEITCLPTEDCEGVIVERYDAPLETQMMLNFSNLLLDVNESFDLYAVVKPRIRDMEFEWTSSAPDVVSVDEYGYLNAKKEGSAIITVSIIGEPELKRECIVTVEDLYDSGMWGNIVHYTVDKDYNLIITQSEMWESTCFDLDEDSEPWLEYADKIQTMHINATCLVNEDGVVKHAIRTTLEDEMYPGSYTKLFYQLKKITFGERFHTETITDMSKMFTFCSELTELDVSGIDTSNVTNMMEMFSCCDNLKKIDVSGFDTSNVTNMRLMFAACPALEEVVLGDINTSKVTDVSCMFMSCQALENLDLSVFDMCSVTNANMIFWDSPSLSRIEAPLNLSIDNVALYCSNEGQPWYRLDTGEQIEYLPMGLEKSVTLSLTKPNLVTDVKLSRDELLMDVDTSYQLSVSFTPEAGTLEWTSSAPDVVSVNAQGEMTAYKEGTAIITACLAGVEDIKAECTVTVADLTASGIWGEYTYWTLDKDGKLIITQDNGVEYEVFGYDEEIVPWFDYVKEVKTMILDATCCDSQDRMVITFNHNAEIGEDGSETVWTYPEMTELFFGEGFHTSYIKDMSRMFYGCNRIESLDLSNFDIGNVRDMSGMFMNCSCLKSLDLSSFDTSNVENMSGMFWDCSNLTEVNIGSLDTSKVTTMYSMFAGCENLKSIDASNFDTANVYDMGHMFDGCQSLEKIKVDNFDTGSVERMDGMFYGCSSISNLDVSMFDTSKLVYMDEMFAGCSGLVNINVTGLDLSSLIYMRSVFKDCSKLSLLDLNGLDTGSVAYMGEMFAGCSSLKVLNMSSIDFSGLHVVYEDKFASEELLLELFEIDREKMKNFFAGCTSLERIYTPVNLQEDIMLPFEFMDADGESYTLLPQNMDYSIELNVGGFGVLPIVDQVYTGSAIKPVIKVMQGAKKLTEGVDYTVSYKNNVKAASKDAVDKNGKSIAPAVTVKGKGNYGGTVTATFNILPATVTGKDVVVSNNITTQSSKQQLLKPTVTVFGKKLKLNADYIIDYAESEAEGAFKVPGSHAIHIEFVGNYEGTVDSEIIILAKDQIKASQLKIGKIATYNYDDGKRIEPTPDVSYKGKELVAGEDYEFSYKNNILPGKATLIITGLKNLDGTFVAGEVTKTFTIKGTPISKAKIEYNSEYVYTGELIQPAIKVTLGKGTDAVELKEDKDYSVSVTNAVNAGKATLSIIGQGGYTGQVKKTFKILPKNVEADNLLIYYDTPKLEAQYLASGAKPEYIVFSEEGELVLGRDYTVSYKNNKKLASASDTKAPTLTLKGKGNYKFTKTLTFDIVKRDLGDESIVAASTDVLASAKNKLSAPVVTDAAGKKLKANKDYTVSYTVEGNAFDGKNAAAGTVVTVAVVAKADSNYTGQTETTYRIVENDINKTKIIIAKQAYKDGEAIEFTEEMIEGGAITITNSKTKETLVYGTDYEIAGYKNNTKKGSATVIIKGIGKYGKTRNVKFSITSKNL